MYFSTKYNSPLCNYLLVSNGKSIIGLWAEGQKYFCAGITNKIVEKDDLPEFKKTKKWLDCYFAGENPAVKELPLSPQGSDFRRQVWEVLLDIPYGRITTYKDIAHQIVQKRGLSAMSAQAVGGAVGHNPISVIIPCHRVIGAGGNLTGYAGGITTKIRLLELEGIDTSGLSLP